MFSTSAQPGWRLAWLGGYFAASAMVLGCAEMIALALASDHTAAAHALRPALVVLLVICAVPMVLMMVELRPAVQEAFAPPTRAFNLTIVIGGGLVLPLVLTLLGSGLRLLWCSAALIVLGNLGTGTCW